MIVNTNTAWLYITMGNNLEKTRWIPDNDYWE